MSEQVDDFLAHYGVRGMKWGKRKARSESDDDESSEKARKTYPRLTKKQVVIGASVLVGVAIVAMVLMNKGDIKASLIGKPDEYKEHSFSAKSKIRKVLRRHGEMTDVVLPQGHVFSRISKVAETNIRNGAYVAYDKAGALSYKAYLGDGKHQVTIESLSEIRMPSRRNKLSTLSDMVDSPLLSPEYNGKTLRDVMVNRQRTAKGKDYMNAVSSKKLAGLVYDRLDLDDFRSGYGKEFTDKLVKKGYSAISDPIDSISKNRKSASIIIDETLFAVVKSKKLSKDDVDKAQQELHKLLAF